MTRINSAIPIHCLTDEHLLAEHREIKRLPYCLEQAIKSGSINHIPDKFTLGKGHVLFFLNKQDFILARYGKIYLECLKRNLKVQNYTSNWNNIPKQYRFGYKPTVEEYGLLFGRIIKRIIESTKDHFHYYGKPITKEKAIDLLITEPKIALYETE